MSGFSNRRNVPTSTSSPSEISSAVVWFTRLVLVVGALSWPLIKSFVAPESNRIMSGCPNRRNVLIGTSSPSEISSAVVWLTGLVLVVGTLS
jgi:hypothetical protein